jgi:predicted ester cyclase
MRRLKKGGAMSAEQNAEQNKAVVQRWLESIDTGDAKVVDEFLGVGFIDHNPPPFPGASPDIEGARKAFSYALKAFSDFHHEINDQYADGDRVITRITGYGKHTGEFLGIPPTGKDVQMKESPCTASWTASWSSTGRRSTLSGC